MADSETQYNEVLLRQTLRTYRNAVVEYIRRGLTAGLADPSRDLAALFGKRDEKTGKTRWDTMRENAIRARATPEISTKVSDDFEVLGVADFYSVFERFFDVLFPAMAQGNSSFHKEYRAGLLRCARQIKVARDPASHEVTEDIGQDELTLVASNAIQILKACGCLREAEQLRERIKQSVATKLRYSVAILASSENASVSSAIERRLRARDIQPVIYTTKNAIQQDRQRQQDGPAQIAETNVIAVLPATRPSDSGFADTLAAIVKAGRRIVPVATVPISGVSIWSAQWPWLGSKRPIVFIPEYEAEAIERILPTLEPETPTISTYETVSKIPVAEAVIDEKLRALIRTELNNPTLRRIWLVSPFATDVGDWAIAGNQLSTILGQRADEGKEITLITRPPCSDEGENAKRRFLDECDRNGVRVFLNRDLHAKIYLFESDTTPFRWFLGSHNLTESGLRRLREASMGGFREPEFQQAQIAAVRIRDHRETEQYQFWKARTIRRAGRPLQ